MALRLFSKRPRQQAWPHDPTKLADGVYGPFLWPVFVTIRNGKVTSFTDASEDYTAAIEGNTLHLVDRHTGKRVDYST